MALLEKARPGREDGGYTRLLGDAQLGGLISQIHATSITAGTELERLICEKHTNLMSAEMFSSFINGRLNNGTYLIPKKLIKSALGPSLSTKAEPDFVVIVIVDKKAYVTELKDGDTFDTKKASGEVLSCRDFAARFHSYLVRENLHFEVSIRVCCFNQDSREAIVKGFKNRIRKEEAWTGRDFCRMIGISYEAIVEQRRVDQLRNLEFFVSEILRNDRLKDMIYSIVQGARA